MKALTMLLKIIKNPRALLGTGLLLLIALVFFMGPRFGLTGWVRLAVVGALLLIFVVIQVVMALGAKRKEKAAAEDLEKSLIIEADQNVAMATDAQKAARENATRELRAAIQVLKDSKLGDGRGGKAALYVLPWYMVLGSDDSGRSEVIRNSGLQRPDRGPGDLIGIGSSPNCEWWFTNQAVILEADRRFVELGAKKGADSGWNAFLELLAKHHSKSPLNGVVITISAQELLQGSKSDIESRARLLRRRLDSMRENLKQVFPVYVLVTKMDLLLGFDGFFSGISPEGAAQILGTTLRQDSNLRSRFDQVFSEEFSLLDRTLRKRRLRRLVQEENPNLKEGTYLFPLEFQGLRDPLKFFISALCEDNAYGANPMLRGFYFVASGGGGEVADVVLSEVSQVMGLSGQPGPALPVRSAPSGKAYFLRDFFRKVLIPDRHIARPTRGAAHQAMVLRRTLQYSCLAALAVFGILLTVSFGRNLALVSNTKLLVEQARNVVLTGNELEDVNQKLQELDRLRDQLVYLDDLDDGRPLTLGLGMYQGGKIKSKALDVYLDRLYKVLVTPTRQELFLWLNAARPREDDPVANSEFRRRYRVYRTLFEPNHGQADLIAAEMKSLWGGMSDREETIGLKLGRIEKHILFAMNHADVFTRYCGADKPDSDLRLKGNAFVRKNWDPETFYDLMIAKVNSQAREFGIEPGRHPGLVSVAPEGSDSPKVVVPGSFTKAAWNDHVRERILNSDNDLREDWLLKDVFGDETTSIRNKLLDAYVSDYRRHWNEFLASVDLPKADNLETVIPDLEDLVEPGSPYMLVLEEASENLKFKENESKVGKDIVNSFQRLEDSFVALHSFVNNSALKDGTRPKDEFVAAVLGISGKLDELRGEDMLANTAQFTKEVFKDSSKGNEIETLRDFAYRHCNPISLGSQGNNPALRAYLSRPAASAWRTCLEVTTRHFDKQWSSEVYPVFAQQLRSKYPCADSEAEATILDYANFFSPEGVLPGFINKYMAEFFLADGTLKEVYDARLGIGPASVTALAKAHVLSQVMFDPSGQPGVECTLTAFQVETEIGDPPEIKTTQVKIGHNQLNYINGPAISTTFNWPDENQVAAAKVFVLCYDRNCRRPDPLEVPASEWAMFKLLDRANLPEPGMTGDSFNIKWILEVPGFYKIAVPYRLNASSQRHPFYRGFLRFNCPRSLRD
jgi:type VI secretion system protein ImpL